MAATPTPDGPVIDADFVRRVARLARLKLDEARLPELTEQFRKILDLVGAVVEIEVPSGDGSLLPPLHLADLRPDEPGPTLTRREVTRNAPAHDGAFLVVPKFRGDED